MSGRVMTFCGSATADAAMLRRAVAAGIAVTKAGGPACSLRHNHTFRAPKASLFGSLPMSQTLHMQGERFASNFAVRLSVLVLTRTASLEPSYLTTVARTGGYGTGMPCG
jgi:hypothetical protein